MTNTTTYPIGRGHAAVGNQLVSLIEIQSPGRLSQRWTAKDLSHEGASVSRWREDARYIQQHGGEAFDIETWKNFNLIAKSIGRPQTDFPFSDLYYIDVQAAAGLPEEASRSMTLGGEFSYTFFSMGWPYRAMEGRSHFFFEDLTMDKLMTHVPGTFEPTVERALIVSWPFAKGTQGTQGHDIYLPVGVLWTGMIANTAFFAMLWSLLLMGPLLIRVASRRFGNRCPRCGYCLRGNTIGTCPECGLQTLKS